MKRWSKQLSSCDFEHLGVVPVPDAPGIQMSGAPGFVGQGCFSFQE